MKRTLFATLFICALPFIAAPALAQSADAITIGTRRVVKSQVLKEDRTVYVQLPESYARSSGYHRYPVLYVHDGGRLGERVALSEGLLWFFGEQFRSSFKEPDRALRYYEMAVEAYPQSEDAKKALSSLRND